MLEAFHLAMTVVMLIALSIGCVSLVQLWIEVKAMKSSTHTLTYIDPLQQAYSEKPQGQKEEKKMTDDIMDNIAMDGMGGIE